jgi:hypothetical protein
LAELRSVDGQARQGAASAVPSRLSKQKDAQKPPKSLRKSAAAARPKVLISTPEEAEMATVFITADPVVEARAGLGHHPGVGPLIGRYC